METRIGSNCFIAGPSVIGPGVTIGDGVIVAPLTFVDRDLADGDIFSAPRQLRKLQERVDRMEEVIQKLSEGQGNAPKV